MTKLTQPNSRVNLDKALEREFGRGEAALRTRTLLADVIVAQMLPKGVRAPRTRKGIAILLEGSRLT